MPVEIIMERRVFGFVPLTPLDMEELEMFPIGATVKVKITRGKSRPMLRFYWALVDEIADGMGTGKDELSHELLVTTRRIVSYTTRRGELYVQPKRISKMDWVEFKDYVSAAIDLIFRDYVAPESRHEVFRVVEARSGTTYQQAIRALEQEGQANGRSDSWKGKSFQKRQEVDGAASRDAGQHYVH